MTRRQRDEWGSIQTVRRDLHYIRYWADLQDGRGYRRCREAVHGSKRDAQRRRAELRAAHAGDDPRMTFGQVREVLWLPAQRDRLASGDLAQNTMSLYETMWRRHIAPKWAGEAVDDIDPLEVQRWLLGLTKWNAVHSLSLAASIADVAIMYRRATTNPFRVAKGAYRMPTETARHTKAVWNLDTVGRAVEALRDTALEVPVMLVGLGSCRVGEAMGQKASEVEFSEEHGMTVARVPVVRQLLKSGELSDKLKTRWSYRTVCVPEPWSLRLREIVREREASGLEWLNDNGLGDIVSRRAVWTNWERAFREGGALEGFEKIPLTSLRNSWETYMRWELGVSPDIVDSMMGHGGKDVRTLHYDRPLPDVYAETCALAHLGAFKASNNLPIGTNRDRIN